MDSFKSFLFTWYCTFSTSGRKKKKGKKKDRERERFGVKMAERTKEKKSVGIDLSRQSKVPVIKYLSNHSHSCLLH